MPTAELNSFIRNVITVVSHTLESIIQSALLLWDAISIYDSKLSFNFEVTFTEKQTDSVRLLLALLLVNASVIILLWKGYGKKVFKRFKRRKTPARDFEKLNRGVSNLKLPKEHSPRM